MSYRQIRKALPLRLAVHYEAVDARSFLLESLCDAFVVEDWKWGPALAEKSELCRLTGQKLWVENGLHTGISQVFQAHQCAALPNVWPWRPPVCGRKSRSSTLMDYLQAASRGKDGGPEAIRKAVSRRHTFLHEAACSASGACYRRNPACIRLEPSGQPTPESRYQSAHQTPLVVRRIEVDSHCRNVSYVPRQGLGGAGPNDELLHTLLDEGFG